MRQELVCLCLQERNRQLSILKLVDISIAAENFFLGQKRERERQTNGQIGKQRGITVHCKMHINFILLFNSTQLWHLADIMVISSNYLVILVIRNHHKKLTQQSFSSAFGNKHILRPATAAVIEGFQTKSGRWPIFF